MELQPIHRAAYEGDLASINQLLQEDGGRLNAQIQQIIRLNDHNLERCTPLMLASLRGHDVVVARLLALGANMQLESLFGGSKAIHWACIGNQPSSLALLLDAGASISELASGSNRTPLVEAAYSGSVDCVGELLARSADIDAQCSNGWTALHWAAFGDRSQMVQRLLLVGADPIIRSNGGKTPLDFARQFDCLSCIPILKAAEAEPQRPRTLLKARALLDASHKIRMARIGITEQQEGGALRRSARLAPERNALAAAPPYLKRRVQQGQELPRVTVESDNEELVACVNYALGLEGGGGVVLVEGAAPHVGMPREVFVELCEMLAPKWARKDM